MPEYINGGMSPHETEFKLLANKLVQILLKFDNPIAVKLIELNSESYGEDKTRNINLRRSTRRLKFTPSGTPTQLTDDGKWALEGRQDGRFGRTLKKVLDENCPDFEYAPTKLEQLVDMLKSEITDSTFSIVNGYDISNVYTEDCSDHLDSCMQGMDENWFDLYCDNTDTISMVVLTHKDGETIGRAMLWLHEGQYYMDRIYSQSDTRQIFFDYAKEKGFLYKGNEDDREHWTLPDGTREHRIFDIKVEYTDFHNYPYLDTFIYGRKGYLSNEDNHEKYDFVLTDTDGQKYWNEVYRICKVSNKRMRTIDMAYCEGGDYYVQTKYAVVNRNGYNILKSQAVKLHDGTYIKKTDRRLVNCYGRGNIYALINDTFRCDFDGRHYLKRGHENSTALIHKRVVINIGGVDKIVHEKNIKKMYKQFDYVYAKGLDTWYPREEFEKAMVKAENFVADIEKAKVIILEKELKKD